MKKILSIDGGGIRGVIPAMVLAEIEQKTGRPVSGLFDLIAGTSTGGILALGLTMRDGAAKPVYSARAMLELYERRGKDIFDASFLRKAGSVFFSSKYPADGIERVLGEYFRDAKLSDALTDVLVVSYETERRMPFFFTSRDAKEPAKQAIYDHPIKAVARATSAAPTYFPPCKMDTADPHFPGHYTLVDGGVFANNPAVCGLVEAMANFPDEQEFLVVSVGTGEYERSLPYDKVKGWGAAEWATQVLDVVFDGVSDAVSYQMQKIIRDGKDGGQRYFRFQASLCEDDKLDDVSPENLDKLKATGAKLVTDNAKLIDRLCGQL